MSDEGGDRVSVFVLDQRVKGLPSCQRRTSCDMFDAVELHVGVRDVGCRGDIDAENKCDDFPAAATTGCLGLTSSYP